MGRSGVSELWQGTLSQRFPPAGSRDGDIASSALTEPCCRFAGRQGQGWPLCWGRSRAVPCCAMLCHVTVPALSPPVSAPSCSPVLRASLSAWGWVMAGLDIGIAESGDPPRGLSLGVCVLGAPWMEGEQPRQPPRPVPACCWAGGLVLGWHSRAPGNAGRCSDQPGYLLPSCTERAGVSTATSHHGS